ncbi:MAG: fluoride efflux transporter CrcB [Planctomycetota bacterium]
MERFLWVCVGGAAGSGARYLVSLWTLERFGARFPLGTLAVNVAGSFAIGLSMHLSASSDWLTPTMRVALVTGVLGGFTTYSAFNFEAVSYAQRGDWALAGGYVALMLCACFAAGWAGHAVAQHWSGA